MTCIIGFKDEGGELWVAADNRISWRWQKPKTDIIHVDELQKLYFPRANVVFAVATANLADVQGALKAVLGRAKTRDVEPADARSVYHYESSIRRLLDTYAKTITAQTDLLVGIRSPRGPAANMLLHYRIADQAVDRVEVAAGDYVVTGSVRGEPDFERFQREVLDSAFRPPGLQLIQRDALFRARWADFQASLPQPWESVGQVFVSVYSDGDHFALAGSETLRVTDDRGVEQAVAVEWSFEDRCFVQVSLITGDAVPLVHLEEYDFSAVPTAGREFRITSASPASG